MISKYVFYLTLALVALSLIYPAIKIFSSGSPTIIGGEDGPTAIVVEQPDHAPMPVHYIMLIAGLAYIASGITLALSMHKP